MNKIKLLPESVYSKIAAGEVIERPASVVRELIDNSIDADAKEIIINIEDCGLKKITVIDDGSGIEKNDLNIALSKHATSKINSINDLLNLTTMGFRGEALHSIQTISKVSITSNTDASGKTPGYKTANFGKDEDEIISIACKKGTKVEVEDIFHNIPVRKKFLKSGIAEWNNIKKVVSDKALSYLNISFKLYNNNSPVFFTNGDSIFEKSFFSIYKNETSFPIYKFDKKINDDFDIELYYSSHDLFFHNRKFQMLFVNRRPVTVGFFYSAIDTGIRNYISPGRHPLVFIYVKINPSLIDVNIHPAKKEIKFIYQNDIFNGMYSCLQEAMSKITNRELYEPKKKNIIQDSNNNLKFYEKENSGKTSLNYFNEVILKNNDLIQREGIDKIKSGDYNILGTAFDTYIIIEKNDKIIFIDFHAASELIIFNRKKEKYNKEKNIEKLIIPIVVDLENFNDDSEKKIKLLNENNFLIERGEGASVTISEMPSILLNKKNFDYIVELIRNFIESDTVFKKEENIIDALLIESSCREAPKQGDKITLLEMVEIVEEYFKLDRFNCPHGRPIHFELTKTSLEKSFQRKK